MLCGSLDDRGVWGRLDTYICMAESLCCPTAMITTLLISYTPIQNKKLKTNKQKTIDARRQWDCKFKVLREKNCQPKILHSAKLSFKSKGIIKKNKH